MSKYLFYPGCSMQKSARAYLDSLEAIQDKINLELEELNDWNCCGATEYMSVSKLPAYALVSRNLAIAQEQANGNKTLTAACSACYLNLAKANQYLVEDKELNNKVSDALSAGDMAYDAGSLDVRHILDVIFNDVGLEKISELVEKPLKGLRVAAYYGCLITRPDVNNRWDSYEFPTALEELLEALGAQVVDFPLKTQCCSGHMTQIGPSTAFELIRRLLAGATDAEADVIVTLCPMCQLNLDAFQSETNKHFKTDFEMPILYFTQLMGLAFGLDAKKLGFGQEFVSARHALEKIGTEIEPGDNGSKPRKKKDEGLPMPQMTGGAK